MVIWTDLVKEGHYDRLLFLLANYNYMQIPTDPNLRRVHRHVMLFGLPLSRGLYPYLYCH